MGSSRYLDIFMDEAIEHLAAFKDGIAALEQEPAGPQTAGETVRALHAIKGMASTMGFALTECLADEAKLLLLAASRDEAGISTAVMDLLGECLLAIERHLEYIRINGVEGKDSNGALLIEMRRLSGHLSQKKESKTYALSTVLLPEDTFSDTQPDFSQIAFTKEEKRAMLGASRTGSKIYGFEMVLRPDCLFQKARAVLAMKIAEGFGWVLACRPALREFDIGSPVGRFTFFLSSGMALDTICLALRQICEMQLEAAGEVDLNAIFRQKEKQEPPADTKEEPSAQEPSAEIQTGRAVCVSADRMERLKSRLMELVFAKNSIVFDHEAEDGAQQFEDSLEMLNHATAGLYESVMQARLVPAETITNRFAHMLHALAQKTGKDMELYISGEQTEIDCSAAVLVREMLWQLIQNAVMYSMEGKEIRIQRKKPPQGAIHLNFHEEAEVIVISVHDDGGGFAADAAGEKESGSTQNLCGLSAACRLAESLGGDIETESMFEKGIRHTIRLPRALDILRILVVESNGEDYAVPLQYVQSVEEISGRESEDGDIFLHGKRMPLVRLKELLGANLPQETQRTRTAVIIKKDGRRAVLAADRLKGQHEAVRKPLGNFIKSSRAINGAAVFGNGKIALILNIGALM